MVVVFTLIVAQAEAQLSLSSFQEMPASFSKREKRRHHCKPSGAAQLRDDLDGRHSERHDPSEQVTQAQSQHAHVEANFQINSQSRFRLILRHTARPPSPEAEEVLRCGSRQRNRRVDGDEQCVLVVQPAQSP